MEKPGPAPEHPTALRTVAPSLDLSMPDPAKRHWTRNTFRWVVPLTAAALVILGAWLKPWTSQSALDRLWSPVLESSSPVLLCVGQRPFTGFSARKTVLAPLRPSMSTGLAPVRLSRYRKTSSKVVRG